MHLTTTVIAMAMITTKMTIGNRGWQMKLANLLELIPEEYAIRLARLEDCSVGDVGTKNDIIAKFAKRNNLTQNKVARMKVLCVYPRVDMKCEEVSFYSGGTLPLRVKPQIVIDIG